MFKSIKILEEIHSTNTYLIENLNELAKPSIVFARKQTAGKGRIGNKWLSLDKGLFTSLVLDIKEYSFELYHYPYLIALLVHRFLKDFNLNAKIKWPNDLQVNKRKISGVLIESKADYLIIGIGININETEEDFKALDLKATSLFIEKHQAHILDDLYQHFIKVFSEHFLNYQNKVDFIFSDWKKECIHHDEFIQCRVGKTINSGHFHDIGERGELLLKNKNELIKVWAGDIIES